MRTSTLVVLTSAMIVGAAPTGSSAENAAPAAAVNAFHAYLHSNQLESKWEGEPATLQSPEIQAAYGGRQFVYTFKAPPVPPGAPMPDVIARYKEALQEHEKHSLRLTAAIDNAQNVSPMEKPEDFNRGLMPIKSDADARTAAAAILSLFNTGDIRPTVINASEVTVMRTPAGWTCQVSRPRAFDGTVSFNAGGKVTSVVKKLNYTRPVPS